MKLSWPNLTFPPVNLRSLIPTFKMIQHNTIDEIVDDLIFKVDQKDIDYLLNPPPKTADKGKQLEYIWARTEFLRYIRNHYGLWHTHPLTKRWREEGANDHRDGVDCSSDHPDNVSGQVFQRFEERLRK